MSRILEAVLAFIILLIVLIAVDPLPAFAGKDIILGILLIGSWLSGDLLLTAGLRRISRRRDHARLQAFIRQYRPELLNRLQAGGRIEYIAAAFKHLYAIDPSLTTRSAAIVINELTRSSNVQERQLGLECVSRHTSITQARPPAQLLEDPEFGSYVLFATDDVSIGRPRSIRSTKGLLILTPRWLYFFQATDSTVARMWDKAQDKVEEKAIESIPFVAFIYLIICLPIMYIRHLRTHLHYYSSKSTGFPLHVRTALAKSLKEERSFAIDLSMVESIVSPGTLYFAMTTKTRQYYQLNSGMLVDSWVHEFLTRLNLAVLAIGHTVTGIETYVSQELPPISTREGRSRHVSFMELVSASAPLVGVILITGVFVWQGGVAIGRSSSFLIRGTAVQHVRLWLALEACVYVLAYCVIAGRVAGSSSPPSASHGIVALRESLATIAVVCIIGLLARIQGIAVDWTLPLLQQNLSGNLLIVALGAIAAAASAVLLSCCKPAWQIISGSLWH